MKPPFLKETNMPVALSNNSPATDAPNRWIALSGRVLLGLLFPLAALLAWTLSARNGWLPIQILPEPELVYQTLAEMVASGELAQNLGISLTRVLYGFAAGALAGLALGALMGLSPTVEDYVKPLLTAIAQVPVIGWVPLLILMAGIGETMKIIVIAKAAFVPVVLNTLSGIRNIPPSYFEVARTFRFTRFQLLRRLVIPGATAPIFTGIRYGLTKAWTALVAVELLASSEGLGYLLVWGRQMFWLDVVIAAMVVIGVIGFLMDRLLNTAELRLQRWRFTEA
jgi:sulfonate transport system permease protein